MKRKNGAAVALGRKGGRSRADILTAEERSEIARKGGLAKAANRANGTADERTTHPEFAVKPEFKNKKNGTAAAHETETELAESTSSMKKK